MSSWPAVEPDGVPALVLAAGRGTRIAAVSAGRPKPLLEVAGRSLLEWNLRWLAAHGVGRVWINLHREADVIRAAIGSGAHLGLHVRYSHETTLLGTAGAWRRLRDEWSGTSLVVYGDNLMRFDVTGLLRVHRETGARLTVALFDPARHVHTAAAGGFAHVEDGRVTAFYEGVPGGLPTPPDPSPSPTSIGCAALGSGFRVPGSAATDSKRGNGNPELINAGVYALEPTLASLIGAGYQDFGHDVLPRLAERGELSAHIIEPTGFCLGVDTPERYARAKAMVAGGAVAL